MSISTLVGRFSPDDPYAPRTSSGHLAMLNGRGLWQQFAICCTRHLLPNYSSSAPRPQRLIRPQRPPYRQEPVLLTIVRWRSPLSVPGMVDRTRAPALSRVSDTAKRFVVNGASTRPPAAFACHAQLRVDSRWALIAGFALRPAPAPPSQRFASYGSGKRIIRPVHGDLVIRMHGRHVQVTGPRPNHASRWALARCHQRLPRCAVDHAP